MFIGHKKRYYDDNSDEDDDGRHRRKRRRGYDDSDDHYSEPPSPSIEGLYKYLTYPFTEIVIHEYTKSFSPLLFFVFV